jgi:hypothetical protein
MEIPSLSRFIETTDGVGQAPENLSQRLQDQFAIPNLSEEQSSKLYMMLSTILGPDLINALLGTSATTPSGEITPMVGENLQQRAQTVPDWTQGLGAAENPAWNRAPISPKMMGEAPSTITQPAPTAESLMGPASKQGIPNDLYRNLPLFQPTEMGAIKKKPLGLADLANSYQLSSLL